MNLLNKIETDLKNILMNIATYKEETLSNVTSTNITTKEHVCDVCNNTFDKFKNLKRHKLRAHGEKKFECENWYNKEGVVCLAKFTEKYALYKHIKKHEKNGDTNTGLSCDI